MRWLRKIVRVFMVVALGAVASLPFRLLPPPNGGPNDSSADRIVLQNDSTKTVQQTPLQIAPPATVAETNLETAPPAFGGTDATRTASNRPGQVNRKDLPAWNSKLESSSPPPPLPDSFVPNGSAPTDRANPLGPAADRGTSDVFPTFTPGGP